MRAPVAVVFALLLSVLAACPPAAGQVIAPCENDTINDAGPSVPPDEFSGFSQVDVTNVCIEESEVSFVFAITTRGQPSTPAAGQTRTYTIAFDLHADHLVCTLSRTTGADQMTGCAGARANITQQIRVEIARGSLGLVSGARLSNVTVTSHGTYQGSLSADDRAPNEGVYWPAVSSYVVGTLAPASVDTDRDGVPDSSEILAKTDPLRPDTDLDGLLDGQNRGVSGSSAAAVAFEAAGVHVLERAGDTVVYAGELEARGDPRTADRDGDGLLDGWDVPLTAEREAAFGAQGIEPTGGEDPTPRFLGEHSFGADADNVDSDGDTIWDGDEVRGGTNAFLQSAFAGFHGSTDPARRDTDHDGLNDSEEIVGKAFIGGVNRTFRSTDPNANDTDQDGLSDFEELLGQIVLPGEEPVDFAPTDPHSRDSDADGYDDRAEVLSGSDPSDASDTPTGWSWMVWLIVALVVVLVILGIVLRKKRT
jgi:hypothetical protein